MVDVLINLSGIRNGHYLTPNCNRVLTRDEKTTGVLETTYIYSAVDLVVTLRKYHHFDETFSNRLRCYFILKRHFFHVADGALSTFIT